MNMLKSANLIQQNNELEYKNDCLHKVLQINEDFGVSNKQLHQLVIVNDSNIINCIDAISTSMNNVHCKITDNVVSIISNNERQITNNKLAIKKENNE